MSPLGRSRGQQPLCLKFLFTIGFENAAINKQVRRKENATKDKQEKMSKNTKVFDHLRMK